MLLRTICIDGPLNPIGDNKYKKGNGKEMKAYERIEAALKNNESFVISIETQVFSMEEIEFSAEDVMDYDGKVISFVNLCTGFNMEVNVADAVYNEEDDWVENTGDERFAISFLRG